MSGLTISGPDGQVFSLPRHATVKHEALDEAVKERLIADYRITSVDFTQDPPVATAEVKVIKPVDHINVSLLIAKKPGELAHEILSVQPLPQETGDAVATLTKGT